MEQKPPAQGGFGLAPLKQEGAIDDPDRYSWECDLNECARCRTRYDRWKKAYIEEQMRLNGCKD